MTGEPTRPARAECGPAVRPGELVRAMRVGLGERVVLSGGHDQGERAGPVGRVERAGLMGRAVEWAGLMGRAVELAGRTGRAVTGRAGQAVWARLRELTGEADYDRYLRRHRSCRGGTALTAGEYWQRRWRHDEQPGTRCC